MTVYRVKGSGSEWIASADDEIIGTFTTNAEAWRALDRHMREPVSKREDTADWISRKTT